MGSQRETGQIKILAKFSQKALSRDSPADLKMLGNQKTAQSRPEFCVLQNDLQDHTEAHAERGLLTRPAQSSSSERTLKGNSFIETAFRMPLRV